MDTNSIVVEMERSGTPVRSWRVTVPSNVRETTPTGRSATGPIRNAHRRPPLVQSQQPWMLQRVAPTPARGSTCAPFNVGGITTKDSWETIRPRTAVFRLRRCSAQHQRRLPHRLRPSHQLSPLPRRRRKHPHAPRRAHQLVRLLKLLRILRHSHQHRCPQQHRPLRQR